MSGGREGVRSKREGLLWALDPTPHSSFHFLFHYPYIVMIILIMIIMIL